MIHRRTPVPVLQPRRSRDPLPPTSLRHSASRSLTSRSHFTPRNKLQPRSQTAENSLQLHGCLLTHNSDGFWFRVRRSSGLLSLAFLTSRPVCSRDDL
ncbi:hypothetical protein GOODEAATRI_026542 [Goodea atripinnis]|uniref:Uncharacterized protein n=1 Tax=Goodea atripinnis TaxID=208336 RepID=A0ABV0P1I0_9TELE